VVAWNGDEMFVWGGLEVGGDPNPSPTSFYRYSPESDRWQKAQDDGPHIWFGPSLIWAGDRLILWGGPPCQGRLANRCRDGTAYDPRTGTWERQVSVGSSYDPLTDTWSPISANGSPTARKNHVALWTGRYMIIWGGHSETVSTTDGARYDPDLDTWSPMMDAGLPPRGLYKAVWTGTRMIVWDGSTNNGASYDPSADVWYPIRTEGAPSTRSEHEMLWTGSEMVVWGGRCDHDSARHVFSYCSDAAAYNPDLDTWRTLGSSGAAWGRDATRSCGQARR
jgi:hypothetical protein